jgi:hypothetical protein
MEISTMDTTETPEPGEVFVWFDNRRQGVIYNSDGTITVVYDEAALEQMETEKHEYGRVVTQTTMLYQTDMFKPDRKTDNA